VTGLTLSGKSVVHFYMLKKPDIAQRIFDQIDRSQVTVLGINDDIEEGYDEIKDMMGKWFEKRWPEPAVWEHR
jgi:3-O-alpha-D-mannopyranosyl-alpha-D-mannopyranose xylosylphosphotransferase